MQRIPVRPRSNRARSRSARRLAILAALVVVWFAMSACSCGQVLDKLMSKRVERGVNLALTTVTVSVPTVAAAIPTVQTSGPKLGITPGLAAQAPQASGWPTIPNEPNKQFTIEMTEQQINEQLAGQTYEQGGMGVSDIKVTLTEKEGIVRCQASQSTLAMKVGLIIRGVPVVHEGKLYIKILDASLDNSVPALMRSIAKAAIDQAIKQYSTPYGVEVPVENVEFQKVELRQGKVIVTGKTK